MFGLVFARKPYGNTLSPAEMRVLRLAADGKENAEIAATVCRGVDTVKTQMRSVFSKLGASNRTAAVAMAMRSGLL